MSKHPSAIRPRVGLHVRATGAAGEVSLGRTARSLRARLGGSVSEGASALEERQADGSVSVARGTVEGSVDRGGRSHGHARMRIGRSSSDKTRSSRRPPAAAANDVDQPQQPVRRAARPSLSPAPCHHHLPRPLSGSCLAVASEAVSSRTRRPRSVRRPALSSSSSRPDATSQC